MIKVGDRLPQAEFFTKTDEGKVKRTTSEVFDGRKVVVFGVPGAFTGTCSSRHLPGYVNSAETLRARGVDEIVCVSVNDADVLDAWSKSAGADGKVSMLGDGNAAFAKATGLDIDLGVAGMGVRCKRFSMLVEDGVVKTLNIEESPGEVVVTGAETMLEAL